MLNFSQRFLIRLLIFIVAISPVQITMAVDFDPPGQNMDCQILPLQSADWADTNMDDSCALEKSGHCIDLSVCAAHTSFTSLRSSISLLLSPAAVTLLRFTNNNESMSTNYPGLLKRPPKA